MKTILSLQKVTYSILYTITLLTTSCIQQDSTGVPTAASDQTAAATITVKIGVIGKLAKAKNIALEKLILTLSCPGLDTVQDTTSISGTGGNTVKTTIGDLKAPRTWRVSAATYDTNDSCIHKGVTTFVAIPADTSEVTLDLAALFSTLKVSFNGIHDSAVALTLTVNGTAYSADSTFTAGSHDTVVLSYDYLAASGSGEDNTLSLKARGTFYGEDTILYTADTILHVTSGANANYIVTLKWVGPINYPPFFTSVATTMLALVDDGDPYVDTLHAKDSDGDPLTFSLSTKPGGMMITDSIISWGPQASDFGSHTVSAVVSDDKGFTDTLSWEVTVRNSHRVEAPTAPSGPQNGEPNVKYGFEVTPVTCTKGHDVEYRFLWGDDTEGEWQENPYDSVTYIDYGIYDVRVIARCADDNDIVSDTSEIWQVGILNTVDGTLLDDCEGSRTMTYDGKTFPLNKFNGPWSTYTGESSYFTNIDTNFVQFTAAEGNPYGSGSSCMRVDFDMENYVGVAMQLNEYWEPKNLTGLDTITFWAKTSESMSIGITVSSVELLGSDYRTFINVSTSWEKYDVAISTLVQLRWGGDPPLPLDISNCIGITFFVDGSHGPLSGTLWIDDIYLKGYEWKP